MKYTLGRLRLISRKLRCRLWHRRFTWLFVGFRWHGGCVISCDAETVHRSRPRRLEAWNATCRALLSLDGTVPKVGIIWPDESASARSHFNSCKSGRRSLPSHDQGYANHVSIAIGSHGELETCVELSWRLGFLSVEERVRILAVSDTVGRLLNGLYRVLAAKVSEP